MISKEKDIKFKSIEDFYSFVDTLRLNLITENFLETSQELNFILHEMAYSTSSEFLGDIKVALIKLKTNQIKELPQNLLTKINLVLEAIENAFNIANSKA